MVASDEDVLTIAEQTVNGASAGTPVKYILKDNKLISSETGETEGIIDSYDPAHSWNNLNIRWSATGSPIDFKAPVLSTYMLSK